jgi:Spy/CpxP family protein refolding chaperone
MKKTKIILGLLAIFLLGMTAGSLLTLRTIKQRWQTGPGGRPPPGVEFIMRHMTRRLELTPAQQQQVRGIIADTHRQFERLRREKMEPESQRILRESDQRVRAMLRPEQQAKFDKLLAARRPPPPSGAPHGPPPPHGLPPHEMPPR